MPRHKEPRILTQSLTNCWRAPIVLDQLLAGADRP
jgi:hypothetical protein